MALGCCDHALDAKASIDRITTHASSILNILSIRGKDDVLSPEERLRHGGRDPGLSHAARNSPDVVRIREAGPHAVAGAWWRDTGAAVIAAQHQMSRADAAVQTGHDGTPHCNGTRPAGYFQRRCSTPRIRPGWSKWRAGSATSHAGSDWSYFEKGVLILGPCRTARGSEIRRRRARRRRGPAIA